MECHLKSSRYNRTGITWTKTAVTVPTTTATYPSQALGESYSILFSTNIKATATSDTDIVFYGCIFLQMN
jgi:hypothetical protein